jgi:1,4-dihydroxy-2-naphthoate octaprenyltransferase
MVAGFVTFALAILAGIPLVIAGGWVIVAIGLVSLVCGYIYTGGPAPLAYKGLGDLFVILFFGVVAVGGVFYIHTKTYNLDALVAGLQIGFLCTVLIAINNLRDRAQDALVNKKTLAVRLGERGARLEIVALYACTFLLNIYWYRHGQSFAAGMSFVSLPLAILLVRNIWSTSPGPIFNIFLAQASLIHLLFGLLFSLGMVL